MFASFLGITILFALSLLPLLPLRCVPAVVDTAM